MDGNGHMLAPHRAPGLATRLHLAMLRRLWGMRIGAGTEVSRRAKLDFTNPTGVHIGAGSLIAADVHVFTHDFVHRVHVDTFVGDRCFIGVGAIVMPGVRIGDGCVVEPGAVVTRDVPAGSRVAGNPARVVESGIVTGPLGRIVTPGEPV